MIPRWLIDKRLSVCANCEQQWHCAVCYQVLDDAPECPLGLLPSRADEVAARAWPAGVPEISGCCDPVIMGA